jgi:hypothetical protein
MRILAEAEHYSSALFFPQYLNARIVLQFPLPQHAARRGLTAFLPASGDKGFAPLATAIPRAAIFITAA